MKNVNLLLMVFISTNALAKQVCITEHLTFKTIETEMCAEVDSEDSIGANQKFVVNFTQGYEFWRYKRHGDFQHLGSNMDTHEGFYSAQALCEAYGEKALGLGTNNEFALDKSGEMGALEIETQLHHPTHLAMHGPHGHIGISNEHEHNYHSYRLLKLHCKVKQTED